MFSLVIRLDAEDFCLSLSFPKSSDRRLSSHRRTTGGEEDNDFSKNC